MSAPAPPAPSLLSPAAPGAGRSGDGLGIADLVTLLGLESVADLPDAAPDGARATGRRLLEAVAVVRAWVRRAADWGSGPQRSWCAW